MANCIIPPALQRGDKVIIIAPSKAISGQADVAHARQILESWGLKVEFGQHLFAQHHQFAGTDAQRAADLQAAFDEASIKAVFCVRGGYGMSRIIDQIIFEGIKKNPKWVIGFSDITLLLSELYKNGVASVHGIMPKLFAQKGVEYSVESLRQWLFQQSIQYQITGSALNREGTTTAELVGGNLTMFCHAIGTSSEIDTKGKILFLEDVGEHLYHIDRLFWQLQRSGKLANLAGLIIGHFSDMEDDKPSFGQSIEQIVAAHTQDFDYPVAYHFPVGHEPQNLALPLGVSLQFSVGKEYVSLQTNPTYLV